MVRGDDDVPTPPDGLLVVMTLGSWVVTAPRVVVCRAVGAVLLEPRLEAVVITGTVVITCDGVEVDVVALAVVVGSVTVVGTVDF